MEREEKAALRDSKEDVAGEYEVLQDDRQAFPEDLPEAY